jgi:hypothetical protein
VVEVEATRQEPVIIAKTVPLKEEGDVKEVGRGERVKKLKVKEIKQETQTS